MQHFSLLVSKHSQNKVCLSWNSGHLESSAEYDFNFQKLHNLYIVLIYCNRKIDWDKSL